MKQSNFSFGLKIGIIFMLAFFIFIGTPFKAHAAEGISLVVDGQKIETSPPPVIKNGRTLVPVRLVTETLGAVVGWNAEKREVIISKGDRKATLKIDNRLINYHKTFGLSDIPPQIINDRTYVPLRLVSNAMGVSVEWDNNTKTVNVDSGVPAGLTSFFDVSIPTLQPWQLVRGSTELQVAFKGSPPDGAAEVRFLLLDPETGRGPIIARGSNLHDKYLWLPDPFYSGSRLVVAAIYDEKGRFLAGEVVPVNVAIEPEVKLKGLKEGEIIKDSLSLSVDTDFIVSYVKYEIVNKDTGKVFVTEEVDPYGVFRWTPEFTDNGNVSIKAIAYDRLEQAHYSSSINLVIDVERKLELRGLTSGSKVELPVTLWLSRNFPVVRTEYLLRHVTTGKEIVLHQSEGYSSYQWFPGPEQAGTWEVVAKVEDSEGNIYSSNISAVQVPSTAKLYIETIGPKQVLTGTVKLKSAANVPLRNIEYRLKNPQTGIEKIIAEGADPYKEYSWKPVEKDAGWREIQAVGTLDGGKKIKSEAIPVRVYLGKIYGPQPVIEKSKFLDFASSLAKDSQETTGMSAALQTAQAILETGWGQYTPVDKYSGQPSYNLFGIKGEGPAGSVTHNTWEEYNGVTFRVDAEFRAYHNPSESWKDHKRLLLNSARYEPFRAVMHDCIRGAWALKRAGYATDSKYPIKLINIINLYDLHLLDEVKP